VGRNYARRGVGGLDTFQPDEKSDAVDTMDEREESRQWLHWVKSGKIAMASAENKASSN
jgi:hypothetical protein